MAEAQHDGQAGQQPGVNPRYNESVYAQEASSHTSDSDIGSQSTGFEQKDITANVEPKSDLAKPITQDAEKSANSSTPGSKETPSASTPNPGVTGQATGMKLVVIIFSLALTVFCVAVDNTSYLRIVIATAVPYITDDFHAVQDIGWYASAYLLTNSSAFQIFFAKFYQYFRVKWVFLTALAIFEIGSLVSAVAPSSTCFIVGRAIAGVGGAGVFIGSSTASAQVSPLRLRPTIIGIMGSLFGFCNIIGPLLGGALTSGVTWRWCFYINLPLGGLAAIGVLSLLHVRQPTRKLEGSLLRRIGCFDPIGNACFIGAAICLLLALQLGISLHYSDGAIIALFVVSGVLFICFIVDQYLLGENATLPPRIIKHRTIQFGALFGLCIGSATLIMAYYLPIWFQAIKGKSPISSAVHMLPLVIAQVIAMISSGFLTTRIGYYMPFVYASTIFLPLGAGLITTFNVGTSTGHWIGYQILLGLGFGFGFQQVRVAVQVTVPLKDIPLGVAALFACQFFGGAIFVAAGQSLFAQNLRSNIDNLHIPHFDSNTVLSLGATQITKAAPLGYVGDVLAAYNGAIMKSFQLALVMACLMVIGALGMEWKSVKVEPPNQSSQSKA